MTHTYKERNKNQIVFLKKLNCYQLKTKLTIEKNTTKSLDTKIIRHGCELETKVYNNSKKLPVPLFSQTAAEYKCNVLTGELHTVKRTATDFNYGVKCIPKKFETLSGIPLNISTTINMIL